MSGFRLLPVGRPDRHPDVKAQVVRACAVRAAESATELALALEILARATGQAGFAEMDGHARRIQRVMAEQVLALGLTTRPPRRLL